jgi:hypothetical protein
MFRTQLITLDSVDVTSFYMDSVDKLSSQTKHMHEEQTVPEPSGQNRAVMAFYSYSKHILTTSQAGNKEAKNVASILGGDDASKAVNDGHRNLQKDPQNQDLAMENIDKFQKQVKVCTTN